MPTDLGDYSLISPIVIAALVATEAIKRDIEKMGLKNLVVTL